MRRMVACIIATGVMVSSTGVTSAYAIGLPSAPASDFEYELSATPVSTSNSTIDQVKVTFQITNNPGFSHLGIAYIYDEDKCPVVTREFSSEVYENSYFVYQHPAGNLENMEAIEFSPRIGDSDEIYECFAVSMTFDIDKDADEWHEFSFAVVAYTSKEEDISYNNLTANQTPEVSLQTCPYIVGDMNDNEVIEISDASAVMTVCSSYGDTSSSKSISVSDLNTLISDGQFINNASLCEMRCAEVADADGNGVVQIADSEEILTFYSNHSSNLPMDTLVGDAQVKTIII